MSPERAYGEGLDTANWLMQGYSVPIELLMGKRHQYLQTCPFIVGDGWNRILTDNVLGVVTSNCHHLQESFGMMHLMSHARQCLFALRKLA